MSTEYYLAKFRFKTGKKEYDEQFILKAESLDETYPMAKEWFKENYPESNLISLVVHPTIGQTITV